MYAEKRRTACLQEVLREMQSLLHDDPERRIVVIIRLLKQEGILCTNSYKDIVLGYIKYTHSDGSSPVTTLVHHVLVTILVHLAWVHWFVRIDVPF